MLNFSHQCRKIVLPYVCVCACICLYVYIHMQGIIYFQIYSLSYIEKSKIRQTKILMKKIKKTFPTCSQTIRWVGFMSLANGSNNLTSKFPSWAFQLKLHQITSIFVHKSVFIYFWHDSLVVNLFWHSACSTFPTDFTVVWENYARCIWGLKVLCVPEFMPVLMIGPVIYHGNILFINWITFLSHVIFKSYDWQAG